MLQAYIGYLLGPGQKLLPELGYAPLPASIDQKATGAAQQDRLGIGGPVVGLVVVSTVTQADQIGSSP